MGEVDVSLSDLLGDPSLWSLVAFFDTETVDHVNLYSCPQCGAAIREPFRHKAWHLQAGI